MVVKSLEDLATNHKTFWQQKQLEILAGRTAEYGPINWPHTYKYITVLTITYKERYVFTLNTAFETLNIMLLFSNIKGCAFVEVHFHTCRV